MKKIIIVLLLFLAVGGTIIFFVLRSRGNQGQAVLKVSSVPVANVFLDNQNIGKTPIEQKVAPGEFTIKLIPETTVESVVSWEDKIKLNPNLLTYVNRELGSSELTSGGETLILEKSTGKKGELVVLSSPDGATVKLSGNEKSTTPVVLSDIDAGNYDLAVEAVGFKNRTVKIKITSGYKLTATYQLIANQEELASPTPEASTSGTPKPSAKPGTSAKPFPATSSASPKAKASPPPKPYIEVLDTPTGFLNVRKDASKDAEILSQIKPGELYSLLDEQSAGGIVWYKITYDSDKEGWVSSQYAKKFE